MAVARLPTGGRAVWHYDEVTYAVAAPAAALGCLRDSYVEIHRRLARALRVLGLDATLAPGTLKPGSLAQGACFAQPVGGENARLCPTRGCGEGDFPVCVQTPARSARAVKLAPADFAVVVRGEMLARAAFPPIGELPYLLTLAPRGFFWFQLRQSE